MQELSKILNSRLQSYCNIEDVSTSIVNTSNSVNIQSVSNEKLNLVINLGLVNNIRLINIFHEDINTKLVDGGIYVSCGETLSSRGIRVDNKTPYGLKTITRTIDFIYKRVFPKLPGFKQIYFGITHGHNRILSKTEILGRVISSGFEIQEYYEENNIMYIITKKVSSPSHDKNASYGPLFKMKRVGYKGRIIGVYKMRTMHPYSEYCQELIIKENHLDKSGKIHNDFRVTTWGKIFRRFWIDELPMLINLFKRDLNIVGVRPLSEDYFSRYPKELQELRIQVKPGLVPPYYADMPKNFDEILESERQYILEKLRSPIITDIKYFYRAFINIVFKGARSS